MIVMDAKVESPVAVEIRRILAGLPAKEVGEYLKTTDVVDFLLDLQQLVSSPN